MRRSITTLRRQRTTESPRSEIPDISLNLLLLSPVVQIVSSPPHRLCTVVAVAFVASVASVARASAGLNPKVPPPREKRTTRTSLGSPILPIRKQWTVPAHISFEGLFPDHPHQENKKAEHPRTPRKACEHLSILQTVTDLPGKSRYMKLVTTQDETMFTRHLNVDVTRVILSKLTFLGWWRV